jgi:hypothetical protein
MDDAHAGEIRENIAKNHLFATVDRLHRERRRQARRGRAVSTSESMYARTSAYKRSARERKKPPTGKAVAALLLKQAYTFSALRLLFASGSNPRLTGAVAVISPPGLMPWTRVWNELGTEMTLKAPFSWRKDIRGYDSVFVPMTTPASLMPSSCLVPEALLG